METSVHHKETFHRKFTVCVWDLPFCYSPQHHAAMKYSLAPHVPPLQAVVQEEGLSILQPIVTPHKCPFKKHIKKTQRDLRTNIRLEVGGNTKFRNVMQGDSDCRYHGVRCGNVYRLDKY